MLLKLFDNVRHWNSKMSDKCTMHIVSDCDKQAGNVTKSCRTCTTIVCNACTLKYICDSQVMSRRRLYHTDCLPKGVTICKECVSTIAYSFYLPISMAEVNLLFYA